MRFYVCKSKPFYFLECNKPSAITDGSFTPDKTIYDHNDVINFVCSNTATHTASGNSTSTCTNGNFVINFKCNLSKKSVYYSTYKSF